LRYKTTGKGGSSSNSGKKAAAGFAGAGGVAAFTGSLVGLGGGFVLIPLLTGVGKFTQHMASGTSLAVVVATGFAGLLTFGGADAIDLPAAALISTAGVVSGYLGAVLELVRVSAKDCCASGTASLLSLPDPPLHYLL
jgi:hypothetical protein